MNEKVCFSILTGTIIPQKTPKYLASSWGAIEREQDEFWQHWL